jgi:hypothetical protein
VGDGGGMSTDDRSRRPSAMSQEVELKSLSPLWVSPSSVIPLSLSSTTQRPLEAGARPRAARDFVRASIACG